jgi:hypothetical protein
MPQPIGGSGPGGTPRKKVVKRGVFPLDRSPLIGAFPILPCTCPAQHKRRLTGQGAKRPLTMGATRIPDFPHLLLLFESFLSSRAVALGPASHRGTPLTLRTPWPTLHGAVCVTCPREAWHSSWLSVSMHTEHRRVSSVCPSMPLVALMAQSRAQPRVRQLLPREEPSPLFVAAVKLMQVGAVVDHLWCVRTP